MAPLLAQKPGVDRAFERLYRRHAADVYRYAFAVLRNQADAEDVAQTTFMNAFRALERGETPQSPHNWLIAIAHNVCRQRFRQQSRRPLEVGLDEDVADHFVQPEDENAPSPENIRRALQHLAFNQRAALVMRELEGRSYAEIADLLGVSVSAVETLIFRARRALREQLDGQMTCGQAEQAISRGLDNALPRSERSQLRAHLRECAECRTIARSQRAQRSALRALGAVPLPQSLVSLFGGGGAVGAAVVTKAAVVVVAAGVAGGIGLDVHRHLGRHPLHRTAPPAAPAPSTPAGARLTGSASVAAAVVPVRHATPGRGRSQRARGATRPQVSHGHAYGVAKPRPAASSHPAAGSRPAPRRAQPAAETPTVHLSGHAPKAKPQKPKKPKKPKHPQGTGTAGGRGTPAGRATAPDAKSSPAGGKGR